MKYTLEISEEQAEIIEIALEEYFRLRMNQTQDFADDICFEGFNFKSHTQKDFDERIERRDMFRDELGKLLRITHPVYLGGGRFREQTIEMRRAQDIWQVIRHQLWVDRHGDSDNWCVDAREPMSASGEPLPKVEVLNESL